MKPIITNDNRNRLFNLLIKEDFRDFIVNKNRGNKYVIDNPDYTSMPNAIACLEKNRRWYVYETDERSKICNKKDFESVIKAYREAASRSGFDFVPSEDILKINPNSNPYYNYTNIPILKIKKALHNAQEIADLMNGEPNGILAEENAEFLNEILKKCRSVSRKRSKQITHFDQRNILENDTPSLYRQKYIASSVNTPFAPFGSETRTPVKAPNTLRIAAKVGIASKSISITPFKLFDRQSNYSNMRKPRRNISKRKHNRNIKKY